MTPHVNSARFQRLQWLFPVAVTLHNIEEAMWLPGWVAKHSPDLPWQVEAGEFRFAVSVLTVAAWLVTYLSVRNGRESVWAYLLFGYIVAMLANVLVPHVPASLLFRAYTPGVVTAVVVNLPVMTLLTGLALQQRWVCGGKAVLFAVGVPVGIAASIPALFAIEQSITDQA